MKFSEAMSALIEQQAEDSMNVTISRIVGDIVDKATEGAVDFGTFGQLPGVWRDLHVRPVDVLRVRAPQLGSDPYRRLPDRRG